MTFWSQSVLLSSIFAISLSASQSLQTSLRIISETDVCLGDVDLPIESILCPTGSEVIGDPRFEVLGDSSQCRSLCRGRTPPFLQPFRLEVDCGFCNSTFDVDPYRLPGLPGQHICIPRHVCIDKCGPEKKGCIYTGSCASQICFRGSRSNKTAEILRYTHRGPGTIILVDNSEGSQNSTSSTGVDNPRTLSEVFQKHGDICDYKDQGILLYDISTTCNFSPLGDGREEAGIHKQCRSVCRFFDFSPYEVVRVVTACDICYSPGAEKWFTQNSGLQPEVCIPRKTCIKNCGPEGYGCVYTGTCQSRICFSGIDSKRPAVFTTLTDDGKNNKLSVNNSGGPVNSDPPVFGVLGRLGNATSLPAEEFSTPGDSSNPSETSSSLSEESPALADSLNPSLSSSPFVEESLAFEGSSEPSTPGLSPTKESPVPDKNPEPSSSSSLSSPSTSPSRNSIWVWLGPVIAVGVLGMLIAAGLVTFVLSRRRAQQSDS